MCPVDIYLASLIYFLASFRHLFVLMEIFDWCPGDIKLVSWRYLVVVLDIFYRCLRDI